MASIVVACMLLVLAAVVAPGFKKYTLKKTVILALLLSISVAGRLLFSGIPSMQTSSYTVIIAGLLFGPAAGFAVGVGTAVLSNLLLGMGPYVFWQALGWGLMGLIAPALSNRSRVSAALYGFLWGYIFGFITNLWYMCDGFVPFSFASIAEAQAASFYFDSIHAVTNLLLLIILPHTAVRKLLEKSVGSV